MQMLTNDQPSLVKEQNAPRFQVVEVLLDKGADPRRKNKFGMTPLHHGAVGGDLKCVKALISVRTPRRETAHATSQITDLLSREAGVRTIRTTRAATRFTGPRETASWRSSTSS